MSNTYNRASVRQNYEKLLGPTVTSEATMQRPHYRCLVALWCLYFVIEIFLFHFLYNLVLATPRYCNGVVIMHNYIYTYAMHIIDT